MHKSKYKIRHIATIQRSMGTDLVVSVMNDNEETLIDIRLFIRKREGSAQVGYSGPTQKGVTLDTELVPQLMDALKKATKEAA